MSHFHISFDDAVNNISYQNLILLSISVPRFKSDKEKEKPKDLFSLLSNESKTTK